MRPHSFGTLLLAACVSSGPLASAADVIETLQIPVGASTFTALAAGPGDGEPVILLHGFPQTSHAWRGVLARLAASGFRAIAPDQRGYSPGARPTAVQDYRIGKLIGDVLGIADAVGAERFHLVGHDWGGAVAWGVASRHSERLLSLTVLSTPHPGALALAREHSDQATRSGYMADLAGEGAEQRLLADDAEGLRAILGDPIAAADRDAYLSVLGTPDALRGALNWYRALLAPPPAGAPAPGPRPPLSAPTLYVWGTADPVFSPDAARATEQFVSGPYTLEPIEGVGHWLLESQPDRVESLILGHVTRHSARATPGRDTRSDYDRARRILGAALDAAGGRRAVLGAFPVSARYAGFKDALGQSLTPDAEPERLDVAGSFAADARGRVFMEQRLVNVGGTDRTFRRVIDGAGGWNDWVPRRLLTEMSANDVAFLRGNDSAYPVRVLPHAVLADAARHAGSLRWFGTASDAGTRVDRIAYADDEGRLLTLLVDAGSKRVVGLEQMGADFEIGDVVWQTRYEQPGRVDGVVVPGHVSFRRDGTEVEAWDVTDVVIGTAADTSVFERPAEREVTAYIPSFQPRPVGSGAWAIRLYSGPANTYNTLLVEFDSFLVVMDAPLVDLFHGIVSRVAAQLAPGKPIRYVVPTHAHFDHIGGIRAYLAAGVTAVATPATASLLERLPAARLTVRPDPLAASGRQPQVEPFVGEHVIREGARELRLYDVGPSDHSKEIVVGYLPDAKLLFVSDLFALPDNGIPAPSTPAMERFVERVEALGLDVETVVAGHGLVASWDDVEGTVR